MILAIDIGNTNIVLGGCRGDEIVFRERLSTVRTATVLEYTALLKTAFEMNGVSPGEIDGAILSSVAPGVTGTMKAAVEKFLHITPLIVGPGIKTGLRIQIDNPAQLGSDMVVAAVAGVQQYPLPLILIDMGTATTLSVVDKTGTFRGGMILPGVTVSHDALIRETAQLQRVAFDVPKTLIGRNTADCMKSGLLYGSAGALDGLIDRIHLELGEPCTAVATGGLANLIAPLCRNKILVDDDLLLSGLVLLYNKNKPSE
ncbi:MAG: type III pantothenate kinase [Clostridia bacterium]|nr:type III pantothenate kinase [Clostridia bacterium]